ncbi:MAG: tRNA dihydrouridine(20/20a) synthase DusA [Proteobacteria bacterium]|nr:tRNA dihydrouridine(20/20a) synthase DusA [Pseudomonadota bacterium]
MSFENVKSSPWRFCIAPMMQYTDRHFRYFARIMSSEARLYTEMVVCDALLHAGPERYLTHSTFETPVALQLGGSDPLTLAQAAILGEAAGFCEINLNVGCPSDRVKSGKFGACLMAEPQLVADCVRSMIGVVNIPVTVKTRIGIDRTDSYDELASFIQAIHDAGCRVVIIHARKAWLDGLSPKENREIPPLRYDVVRQLKRDFPDLTVVINGGVDSIAATIDHLHFVDGVMIGRAAYNTPFFLAEIDRSVFGLTARPLDRETIFKRYLAYAAHELEKGTSTRELVKPLHYLYQGQPGARQWRRHLSERCAKTGAGIDSLADSIRHVERAVNADHDALGAVTTL